MITDRLKVQVDILMPFQKESSAELNSKFPNQRAFQNSIPLRVKFQNPQWSLKNLKIQSPAELRFPAINPQLNQASETSPHRDICNQTENSQSYLSNMSLSDSKLPQ